MRMLRLLFLVIGFCSLAASARAAESIRVLMLPVVMHTLEEQPFLQDGLTDMLASRLRRTPGVVVATLGDSKIAVHSAAEARKIGEKRAADFVVYGSFTQFGDGVSLDLQCAAVAGTGADGSSRAVFIKSGNLSGFIPQLDELVDRLSLFVKPGASRSSGVAAAPPAGGSSSGGAEARALEKRVDRLENELRELRKRVEESEPMDSGAGQLPVVEEGPAFP